MPDVDLVARAKAIADLLDVRDGVLDLAGFEQDDVAMDTKRTLL